MLFKRVCALEGCTVEFQTDNSRKMHCSKRHTTLDGVRRHRAKHRKGGGGGGNGGGGGESPTLFETLTPVDSRAIYVPDTCYRTPDQEPARKPSVSVSPKAHKAAA
jgi:hypothetical protein